MYGDGGHHRADESEGLLRRVSPSPSQLWVREQWRSPAALNLLFPLGGLLSIIGMLASSGSWDAAVSDGLRQYCYGFMVTGFACSAAVIHIFKGSVVAEAVGLAESPLSRMFQVELGSLCASIGCCSVAISALGIEETNSASSSLLATAWAMFLIVAGLRHLAERDPIVLTVADLWSGVQTLVVAWL